MVVKEINIKSIHPYENNPRKNDDAVDAVAESIKQFGWKQPIVIDKDGVIIAGHTRYKAAQKLGCETVPCVRADDLTEEQVKAYRLADNRTADLAAWDFDMLDQELASITDIDMEDFGFSIGDNDLKGMFTNFKDSEGKTIDEDDPGTQREEDFEPDMEETAEKYGVPYKGSKSRYAEQIISFLPAADCFVDLFAGGCAMTHAAILSGKYKRFIINDIEGDITQFFLDAVAGKYKDEKRWISREDFFELKDSDPYVRYCWSFGNDGRTYLYGDDIEPYKRLMHEMVVADTIKERRLKWRNLYRKLFAAMQCDLNGRSCEFQNIDRLVNLERLERLQQLESLASYEHLERYVLDYQGISIPDGAVIYCDIPYKGTEKYQKEGFDYKRFYEWAEKQENIYISEYWMPDDFVCVKEIQGQGRMQGGNQTVIEKLYVPR